MKATAEVVEIPTSVLNSVDTLDELEDWLMANNPGVMRELRQARRDDLAVRGLEAEPELAGLVLVQLERAGHGVDPFVVEQVRST